MAEILTLGEMMLRLSTDLGYLLNSSYKLNVNYGGSEANVASVLANLGHHVRFASKVPDSPLGDAAVRTLHTNHVDTSFVLRGGRRIGVYYLEKGDSLRFSRVIYDRQDSAVSQMDVREWDFDRLFQHVSLFHISGITFALSEKWSHFGQELVKAAYDRGIPVSFDINFRQKMWSLEHAKASICPILPMVSYCCANYLDAHNFFKVDASIARADNMEACYREISGRFPHMKALYATDRHVFSTSDNNLQGMLWKDGRFVTSKNYQLLPIVDRIGGGDAFVAGMLHGILSGMEPEQTVRFGTATALLKHTVNGDWIPISERDVLEWLDAPDGEVKR